MHRILLTPTLSFLLLAAAPSPAAEPPSELVWQDQFDIGGHLDRLDRVVVSEGYLVVDGLSWLERRTQSGRRERATHVNAYDLETGELVWRQQFRAKSAFNLFVERGVVILTGLSNFRVWAFDLTTGELLWESFHRDVEAEQSRSAVSDGIVYSAGYWVLPDPNRYAILVEARDVQSGALLWRDGERVAPSFLGARIASIAAHKTQVVVLSGFAGTATLTAYDGRTGIRLWERTLDAGEIELINADGALCGRRLVLTGVRRGGPSAPPAFVFRTVNARNGETLWERIFPGPDGTSFSPTGLVCDRRRAYAAAQRSDGNDQAPDRLFLFALHAKRGTTLWRTQHADDRLFGRILQLERGSLLVRVDDRLLSYARRQGELLWELEPHPGGGWSDVDLAPNGDLAVAADIFTDATHFDAVVRVLR